MRLNLLLPDVKPNEWQMPKQCKKGRMQGKRFIHAGKWSKKRLWMGTIKSTGMAMRVCQLWVTFGYIRREWDVNIVPIG
jgi:hypothetical protein